MEDEKLEADSEGWQVLIQFGFWDSKSSMFLYHATGADWTKEANERIIL